MVSIHPNRDLWAQYRRDALYSRQIVVVLVNTTCLLLSSICTMMDKENREKRLNSISCCPWDREISTQQQQITRETRMFRDRGTDAMKGTSSTFNGTALTANELAQLWNKYKLDGHFKVEKNSLPQFVDSQQENSADGQKEYSSFPYKDNYESTPIEGNFPEVMQMNRPGYDLGAVANESNHYYNLAFTDRMLNERGFYPEDTFNAVNHNKYSCPGAVNSVRNDAMRNLQFSVMNDIEKKIQQTAENSFSITSNHGMKADSVNHNYDHFYTLHREQNDQCFNNPNCILHEMCNQDQSMNPLTCNNDSSVYMMDEGQYDFTDISDNILKSSNVHPQSNALYSYSNL